ncbi:MAG: lipase family alpha/beta hydrolase [Candidatus Binataceae bacterium]
MESSSEQGRSEFSAANVAEMGAALVRELLSPAIEFGALLTDPVFWGRGVARGDEHPVMVVPGLFAGDGYLIPMRDWLRRIGYTPVRSRLNFNPGWSEELVAGLGDFAEEAFIESGQRVTIIGHSMGGVIARSIGVRRPDAVQHVVTLGSPLSVTRRPLPAQVRITAIYSRSDLIVEYPEALASDPGAVNIEVRGGHAGLAVNPDVYRHLAEVLRRPAPSERD